FSSRRRHTRCYRDWSSDVCSSDLGRRAVELTKAPVRPSQIINAKSVENAVRVLLAIGGSTNAIVHLTAIAGRAGVQIDLKKLNRSEERRVGKESRSSQKVSNRKID